MWRIGFTAPEGAFSGGFDWGGGGGEGGGKMKLSHLLKIGGLGAILYIGAWADDPVAPAGTTLYGVIVSSLPAPSTLPGWIDHVARGQFLNAILYALGGLVSIIVALAKKGAWLPRLIKLAPWFARPFVVSYLDKRAVAAELMFPYPENATPEQIADVNKKRKEWLMSWIKIAPWWIQWFFSNLTDEQAGMMVEVLILKPTREFRRELATK